MWYLFIYLHSFFYSFIPQVLIENKLNKGVGHHDSGRVYAGK